MLLYEVTRMKIEREKARRYPNMFFLPTETLARLTKPQRLWIGERTSQALGSAGLVIDLEPLTLDELYTLDDMLTWIKTHRRAKLKRQVESA